MAAVETGDVHVMASIRPAPSYDMEDYPRELMMFITGILVQLYQPTPADLTEEGVFCHVVLVHPPPGEELLTVVEAFIAFAAYFALVYLVAACWEPVARWLHATWRAHRGRAS